MKTRGHGSGSGSGATLIEVVITIGILIATLVPLIGLLSVAIDTSGKAAMVITSARISAGLISEVQQSDWASLQAWNGRELYFDDQGKELAGPDAPIKSVYAARVKLGAATGVSMGTQAVTNEALRQVVVMVTSQPVPDGTLLLDEAETAIATGKEIPKGVRLSRAMLVNLEKPPGV